MNNFLNSASKEPPKDPLETRRKKAEFRSFHRGSKEMDLIMGQFAKIHLPGLTEQQLTTYESMLDVDDAILWDWVVGRGQPQITYRELLEKLKQYTPDALRQ